MVVHIITGKGAGKTTSALGVAMRSLGHGHKVVVVQFMKGRKDIGEFKIAKKLKGLTLKQFGRKQFVKKVLEEDKELARKGMQYAEEALKLEPHLMILDEIIVAIEYGLVNRKEVIALLKKVAKKTDLILTGRNATPDLKKKADIVTEIKDTKRPRKMITKKGITH